MDCGEDRRREAWWLDLGKSGSVQHADLSTASSVSYHVSWRADIETALFGVVYTTTCTNSRRENRKVDIENRWGT